ncbi:MAG: epoxyqueuosine reductase QueH [Eggerthellaceae bacterium]|jgi:predicted adenine nucleotide alpha hydrolase (AANH) superfamily ATPase
MRMLLHACCGPCSLEPTRILAQEGHTFDIFYANSNIAPHAEYERRLDTLRTFAQTIDVPVIEGAYDPAAWERTVAPVGESLLARRGAEAARACELGHAPATVGELLDDEHRRERCRLCYRMRLEEAARQAKAGGYDALTTTLAVSPYQFTDVIREELDRAAEQAGVRAYFEDWRPFYDEATRRSRALEMYRQPYCGCRFSIAEAEATRAFIREQQHERKLRKQAEQAEARARAEEERQRKAQEKRAYAEKQRRKRAVLKRLRAQEAADKRAAAEATDAQDGGTAGTGAGTGTASADEHAPRAAAAARE